MQNVGSRAAAATTLNAATAGNGDDRFGKAHNETGGRIGQRLCGKPKELHSTQRVRSAQADIARLAARNKTRALARPRGHW